MTAGDRAALVAALDAGARPGFTTFWSSTPAPGQDTGPWVLAQWYRSPFEVDGVRYATAEQWMMASKARLFGDDDALARVLTSGSPAEAKRAGREVRGFDSARWAACRFDVVVAGNRAKFGSDPVLGDYLRSTGDTVLVEASPADPVWGVGMAADEPGVTDPRRWRGENLLGFALMRVRDDLRSGGA
ncbi:NADAR family protein [Pseudonocardia nematodicida]|uniref:NADAR family protein n=1 Tax=Pseudonocardia nematodicida TaxID=1206997 RepID=A0ABV1KJ05_9PSEU